MGDFGGPEDEGTRAGCWIGCATFLGFWLVVGLVAWLVFRPTPVKGNESVFSPAPRFVLSVIPKVSP